MYKISELAKKVGLSRTALLYYEKQKLISSERLENGYRVFSEQDLQRVRLIQQLQLGGLTLQECKVCLEAKVNRNLLEKRLKALDQEIDNKQQARKLLAAMIGQGDLKPWHENLNRLAPDAHLAWLVKQGFTDKEAFQLKWLSKNMNEHEQYMADFMKVYSELEYWGPGSEEDTLNALSHLPKSLTTLLELGCGKGLATTTLARNTKAKITAVDNEPMALEQLAETLQEQGFAEQVTTVCGNMAELPFQQQRFDAIWAEGSAYIIGVEKALKAWKSYLSTNGHLVFSDMVWRTDKPSDEPKQFWTSEYPDMQSIETRIKQMEKAGYQVVAHFPQSEQAWRNYYEPLANKVKELEHEMASSAALQAIKKELAISSKYSQEFGYHMFVLVKQ